MTNDKPAIIDNNKIKWFVFENYFAIILFAFLSAFLSLIIFAGTDWKILLTIVGTLLSFVYFIQKQQLDETKFINELFVKFNQRYDALNEKLNDICKDEKRLEKLETSEIATLNDYFNLCGEEYLFYRKGYIFPEVWKSWVAGMKVFYENERIEKYWLKELSNESYYKLNVENEIKKIPKRLENQIS